MKTTGKDGFEVTVLGDSPLPPWLLGFQCNERYLQWDSSAQIQLLKIHAAREMGKVCTISCGGQVLLFSSYDSSATRAAVVCKNELASACPTTFFCSARGKVIVSYTMVTCSAVPGQSAGCAVG